MLRQHRHCVSQLLHCLHARQLSEQRLPLPRVRMPVPTANRLVLQTPLVFQRLIALLSLEQTPHVVSRNSIQKCLRLSPLGIKTSRLLNQRHKCFLHHLFRRFAPPRHMQRKPENPSLVPPIKKTKCLFIACRQAPQQKLVSRFVPLRHPFPFDVSAALLDIDSPAPAAKFQNFPLPPRFRLTLITLPPGD